jgi:hypothetical protein
VSDLRVIVTGSRDWEDPTVINVDLSRLSWHAHRTSRRLVVIHGAHWSGVDLHARYWVHEPAQQALRVAGYLREEPYPANWGAFRRSAGPRRNQHMVSLGADLCLAYPLGESKGTRGCAAMASKTHIPTLITEGAQCATTLESRLRRAGITILEGQ